MFIQVKDLKLSGPGIVFFLLLKFLGVSFAFLEELSQRCKSIAVLSASFIRDRVI